MPGRRPTVTGRLCAAALLALAVGGCVASSSRPAAPPRREEAPAASVREIYRRAVRALRRGRAGEAAHLLAGLEGRYPVLADHVLALRADAARRLGETAGERLFLERLVAEHPGSIHVPSALLRLAQFALQQGDAEGALALLARLPPDPEALDPGQRARAELLRGDAARLRGDDAGAFAAWGRVRRQFPGSGPGREAAERIRALRAESGRFRLSAEEIREELEQLLREGDAPRAVRLAASWAGRVPREDCPVVGFLRVRALLAAGRTDEAVAAARQLERRYRGHEAAGEALALAARSLWNRDRDREAAALYEYFTARYPRHHSAPGAWHALARIAESAGDVRAARSRYRSLIRRFPRHPLADAARWRLAWSWYREGLWTEARRAFAALRRRAGADLRVAAAYWEARAAEAAGAGGRARALYRRVVEEEPESYYAAWAERRLGLQPARAGEPVRLEARVPPLPDGCDRDHWLRARELFAVGLPGAAGRELRAFERDNATRPAILPALAAAYARAGRLRDVLRLRGAGAEVGDELLYPRAFAGVVVPAARRHRIDPNWVWALIRQESFFDPAARSRAGAIGLMQLMPATACSVARRQGRGCAGLDLEDPATNVGLGVGHLRELIDLYGGDMVRVLAAYNAGIDAVRKWDARNPAAAPDEWLEDISYRETRHYVKRVFGHYRRYRALYGPAGTAAGLTAAFRARPGPRMPGSRPARPPRG